MNWFVYMIEASDNSYYTGITTDLDRRFNQHANGSGAKYFRGRKPLKIIYVEHHLDRSSASIREALIKKKSHLQKQQLAGSQMNTVGLKS